MWASLHDSRHGRKLAHIFYCISVQGGPKELRLEMYHLLSIKKYCKVNTFVKRSCEIYTGRQREQALLVDVSS